MNRIIAGLGVLLVASIMVTALYKMGYNKGTSDELQKWKIAELKAIQEQRDLVDALNSKIHYLEGELTTYNEELDRVKDQNDENIKKVENENVNNECVINGNLNRLHDSFTHTSN